MSAPIWDAPKKEEKTNVSTYYCNYLAWEGRVCVWVVVPSKHTPLLTVS